MAITRIGPNIKGRDWRSIDVNELSRAEAIMAWIEAFCVVPEGDLTGQPLKLAQFQEDFIYDVYDNPAGTEKAILSMARKNSKTATIATLVLVHLDGPEAELNSRMLSGAMSREQAAEVFELASKMIRQSELLSRRIDITPSKKQLVGLELNTQYTAISAEAKTAHGKSPRVAVIDELGQVKGPRSEFFSAIETAQGAYDSALLIIISTQASDDGDLLSIMIDDAKLNKPETTVCHVYEADADSELLDESSWYDANPALGLFRSLKDMRKLSANASRMPAFENQFRNLNLNQRVSTVSPFISRDVWMAAVGNPDYSLFEDGGVIAGLDLSMKKDLTALVLVVEDGNSKVHAMPLIFTPADTLLDRALEDRAPYDVWVDQGYLIATPGRVVDYDWICEYIDNLGFEIELIKFDRWKIDSFKAAMERTDVMCEMKEHGQGYKDMSPALDRLEQLLLDERLIVPDNPCLTWCAANATVESDPAGNRKLKKAKGDHRYKIDPIQALAMAVSTLDIEGDFTGDVSSWIG